MTKKIPQVRDYGKKSLMFEDLFNRIINLNLFSERKISKLSSICSYYLFRKGTLKFLVNQNFNEALLF